MLLDEIPAGTIAVGVDGSVHSERALHWAIEEARATRRALVLVHAVLPVSALAPEAQFAHLAARAAERAGHDVLAVARALVEATDPGLTVLEHLRIADPRDALISVSREAHMLVLGSRGRGPIRSLLLGSVGVAVIRHSRCVTVVTRSIRPDTVRRGVLVGIDGTARSLAPLELACREASQRGLPLTVLHARHEMAGPEGDEEAGLLVAEAISGAREKFPDVPVHTEIAMGQAGEQLVERARDMDLVVVGSHHGGVASEILLGSVASFVVEHAETVAAVVPTTPEPED